MRRQPVIPTDARSWPVMADQAARATTTAAAAPHYPKAVENTASLPVPLALAGTSLADTVITDTQLARSSGDSMKGNPMKISTLTALAVVLSLLAASAAQAGVP